MIQNVLRFLREFAEAYPRKTTFTGEHTNLAHHWLPNLSVKIGSVLRQKTGPYRPVPVLAERNVFILTAFMSIVRTGCFYIFLDVDQPAERPSRILSTPQADPMIVDKESLSLVGPVSFSGEILPLGGLISLPGDILNLDLPAPIRRQSTDTGPPYDIFTSGPTGVPEGVMTSHRFIIDFIGHFTNLFHVTQGDIIGNQASFDFDVSVKNIYSTFKTGVTLEAAPEELFSIPAGLLDYLCDRKITTAVWVISALCIITTLEGFTYCVSSRLNKILFSGEVTPVKHLNAWHSCLPKALFVNLYGPTEITYSCTYYVVDRESEPGAPIPIGKSFPNETVLLLGKNNRLITKPRQNGELCMTGTALAPGYYRDPRHTTMVLTQDPLNSCYSETIYRAGDLACYGRGGLLYFSGHEDPQIRHIGHRIELDEIEAVLEAVEDVDRAVYLLLEERNRIAALYEGTAVKKDVTVGLESLPPYYMFPNLYKNLAELPRTKSGKVDRQALRRLYG